MNAKSGKGFGILVTFCAMFLFWILLSGIFDALHIGAGIICSAIIALISHDLLVKEKGEKMLSKSFKFVIYLGVGIVADSTGELRCRISSSASENADRPAHNRI